jgi:hypothetical protein
MGDVLDLDLAVLNLRSELRGRKSYELRSESVNQQIVGYTYSRIVSQAHVFNLLLINLFGVRHRRTHVKEGDADR